MTREITKREESTAAPAAPAEYSPYVDIRSDPDGTVLEAELPGVEENAAEVNIEHNILTIAGTSGITPPENHRLVREEFSASRYAREFEIGHGVDRAAIRARLKNGLLTVTLPRGESAKPRKINVTAG